VKAARQAFDEGPWPHARAGERVRVLHTIADLVREHADELMKLQALDNSVPLSFGEIYAMSPGFVADVFDHHAGWADKIAGETLPPYQGGDHMVLTLREPVGVVGAVIPWNAPLVLFAQKVAPALAAGCTVVLKPAAQTCLSAYILAEAFEAADFPPGVFNLVTGTHEVAELLARHPGVDKVSFAGPASVGRRIAVACGETFKSVNLELGGKAAAIVLEDADPAATPVALGRLAFANAGQTCFAASRVLAPRSRYSETVAGLREQAAAMAVGDPMVPETAMGPLVSPHRRAGVEAYVTASTAAGARVVAGGRRPAAPVRGYYYEPTVLAADAAPAAAVAALGEVFGPVVTVIPYAREAEAVAIANEAGPGLAGTVWTSDPDHGVDIARRIHVGTFGVNLYVPDLGSPWGGKAGGQGSTYGPECLGAYLRPKSVFLPEPYPSPA
jgi:aldehyde dehydrogenase (NAD+)